jgi:hypothetical protein
MAASKQIATAHQASRHGETFHARSLPLVVPVVGEIPAMDGVSSPSPTHYIPSSPTAATSATL